MNIGPKAEMKILLQFLQCVFALQYFVAVTNFLTDFND